MTDTNDILILGGGMAGGLMAAALANTGLDVRVLDGGPEPQPPGGDPRMRVSAITAASHNMLAAVGAWSHLPPERLCAYRFMHVWDADGTGEVRFSADEAGADCLGWIIENDAIVAALYQAVSQTPVQWQTGARIANLRRDEEHWRVELADGTALRAPMVIGADGARSLTRQAAGISAPTRDTGHMALVATVHCEKPHGDCARQRFMETGPLALLPLYGDGHRFSLVWSCWPEEAERLRALDRDAFNRELTRASEGCLGELRVEGELAGFPVRELHAGEYVRQGLALIGDAAHVIHPLAGQGINLGMLDAGVLAEEIHRALKSGLPFYDDSVLRRYQRRRRGHNALMQNAMRGFKFLFEQRAPEVRFVRNLGMGWVNRLAPAKAFFAKQALGLNGDIPALARRRGGERVAGGE